MQYLYKMGGKPVGGCFYTTILGFLASIPYQQKYRHQPTVPDPAFLGKIAICHKLQHEQDSSYTETHPFPRQLSMGATLWLWLQMEPIQARWQPGTRDHGGCIWAKSLLFLQETCKARSTGINTLFRYRSAKALPIATRIFLPYVSQKKSILI